MYCYNENYTKANYLNNTKERHQKTPPVVWAIAITLSIVAGLYFIQDFLGVIILALLLAFVFYPLYDFIRDKTHSKSLASALTTLASLLLVAIPVMIIISITIAQALSLIESFSTDFRLGRNYDINQIISDTTLSINNKIEDITGIAQAVEQTEVHSFVNDTVPKAASAAANSMLNVLRSLPALITALIIYLFIFTAGLTEGKKLIKLLKELSPFDTRTNDLYIDRIGSMAKAMIKGQLVIAIVQGTISAGVLALVGFSDYFLFLAVVLSFLSFIPLGAGIITIPAGILLLIFGDIAGGLAVLINHFVVTTNVDNIIRPKLVPKDAQLHPALVILGAFAGVLYFGFLGVIYGPIIMIIISTTIESYIAYKKRLA